MFVPTDSLLDRTAALLDEWAGVDWQACDPEVVAVAAGHLVRFADRLEAISLLAVGEHDRRGGIKAEGDGSTGDWMARQTKSSKGSSNRDAARSRRLQDAPESAQAAAEGRLSTEQADTLASAVTDENRDEFHRREGELIAAAEESLEAAQDTAKAFREETGETPEQRADRLHRARKASVWDGPDGMIHGRQSLAGEDGATFRNIVQAFIDREYRNRPTGDPRTAAQRRADAFLELARHAAAALNGETPTRPSVPTVTVHIDLADLTNGTGSGEDETTGTPITGEAARRLACDCGIVRMITKGPSEIIDIGRLTRTIPVPTRRAVLARDGGCTYPGCSAPPDWVQVHHLQHWANLGRTDLANLTSVCHRHHHLLHEGRWHAYLDPATQRTIWQAPDGRTLIGQHRRQPPPVTKKAA